MRLIYSTQFKKDYKRIKHQEKDVTLLENVIKKLLKKEQLEPKDKDHKLITDDTLIPERKGSHSDLFR